MKSNFENLDQLSCYLQKLGCQGDFSQYERVEALSNIAKQSISQLQKLLTESEHITKKITTSDNFILTPTSFYLKRERWLKVTEASHILNQTDGHITHLANKGILLTNGKKGSARRVSLADLLLFQRERDLKNIEIDKRDIARDSKKLNKNQVID